MSTTGTADFGFSPPTAGRREAAFRAAGRHTRAVRALRVVFPAVAVLVIGAIVLATMFDPRVLLAEVDAESMGVTGSKIVMERPRLTGYSTSAGKAKGYEVTAARAEQDITRTHEVDLFALTARMELRDKGWAELVAPAGHMNSKTEILDLFDAIRITTDLGDRAALTDARVDFAAGEIATPQPVAISFGRADLKADTMRLFSNGERAIFSGNVRMVLRPDPAAPVAPSPNSIGTP